MPGIFEAGNFAIFEPSMIGSPFLWKLIDN